MVDKNPQEAVSQDENQKREDEKISEYGQTTLGNDSRNYKIHLLSVIGEIEGHE